MNLKTMPHKIFPKEAVKTHQLTTAVQDKLTRVLKLLGPAVIGITMVSTSFAAEGLASHNPSSTHPGSTHPSSTHPGSIPDNTLLQLAQAGAPSARSITVSGRGRAPAPAEQAVLMFFSQLNYSYTPGEETDPPDSAPENAIVQAADVKPIVDALVSSGIPQSNITFVPDSYSAQSFRLLAVVDQPTRDRLSALVDQVTAQLQASEKFMLGQTTVAYIVDSCSVTEEKARELAVADAQNQAQAMASTLNRTLGELSAITTSQYWGHGYSPSVCPSEIDALVRYLIEFGSAQAYNPLIDPETFVATEVTITYDLE